MAESETIGIVKDVGNIIGDLIGGGGEKGSGQTKPETLAHAIDKLDKANDIEALNIAPEAVQLRIQGASKKEVAQFIGSELGYSPGQVFESHKFDYIDRMIDKEVQRVRAQQKASSPGISDPQDPTPMAAAVAPATTDRTIAGIPIKTVGIVAGVIVIGIIGWQMQ